MSRKVKARLVRHFVPKFTKIMVRAGSILVPWGLGARRRNTMTNAKPRLRSTED